MEGRGTGGLSSPAAGRPRRWNSRLARLVFQLLVAAGIPVCILTGWYAVSAARALLRAPEVPLVTTVASAPADRWVTLSDVVLDCSTRQVRHRSTLVLANDRTGTHPFVAQLVGSRACQNPTPGFVDGAFIGPFTRVFLRERQAFPLPPGEDLRVFSQYQAPRFLRRALRWRIAWFGVSLLLTMLGIRGLWLTELPRAAATKSGRVTGRG